MPYKSLLILIEGDHDKIFFDKVIKPLLEKKYHQVHPQIYSKLGKMGTNTVIDKFKNDGNDYIFVTDMEKIQCISGKKQERMTEFHSIDDKSKIMVVVRKIECWYTAGLSDDKYKELGFNPPVDTSKSGKGLFKKLLIKRRLKNKFMSDIFFMQEILMDFDIETAKQRNTSFKYFIKTYCS